MRYITQEDWLEIFAAKVQVALIESHTSQRDLAIMSGLSEATISCYIHKTKMPGVKAILNIAHALDMTVEELIDYGADIF